MAELSFTQLLAPLYAILERFTRWRYWRLWAVGLFFGCSLAFQVPAYKLAYDFSVLKPGTYFIYDGYRQQVAHPLTAISSESDSHLAKMTFRLTVPLLAKGLHLSLFGVLAVQLLLGLVMFYWLLRLLQMALRDDVAAFLLTLGMCFTYFGSAYVHDVYCFFDAFGYAALVFLLAARRLPYLLLLTAIGGFVDERVLVASLLALWWHSLWSADAPAPRLGRPALTPAVLGIVAGWLAYGAVRYYLATTYHLNTHGGAVGVGAMAENLQAEMLGLGFISGLESYWLLLLLALLLLAVHRQWLLLTLLLAAFLPAGGGSFLVYDMTRSLGYAFPVVLLAALVTGTYLGRASVRHLALVVLAFAILTPPYYAQFKLHYAESIFEKALHIIL